MIFVFAMLGAASLIRGVQVGLKIAVDAKHLKADIEGDGLLKTHVMLAAKANEIPSIEAGDSEAVLRAYHRGRQLQLAGEE